MFKLILNGLEEEYDILTNANEDSFTIVCATEGEALGFKDKLTIEALKLIKYKQTEGVYSIVENKEYANKYTVEEIDDKIKITYYLIAHVEDPINAMLERLLAVENTNNINTNAIVELASVIGGDK